MTERYATREVLVLASFPAASLPVPPFCTCKGSKTKGVHQYLFPFHSLLIKSSKGSSIACLSFTGVVIIGGGRGIDSITSYTLVTDKDGESPSRLIEFPG